MSTIQERIEQIKERADKATPGPWEYWDEQSNDLIVAMKNKDDGVPILALAQMASRPKDFQFVAAARTDVPDLCRALEIAVKALSEIDDDWTRCYVAAPGALAQIEAALKA